MITLGITMIVLGIAVAFGALWAFSNSNFITNLCIALAPLASAAIIAGATLTVVGIVEWLPAHVMIK